MGKVIDTFIEAIKGAEIDYTKGSMKRAIALLSIPMIVEMLGEGFFAIIDAYYVSQVSNEAFATVILTETVATLIYAIAIGISIATSAMVARRVGEKEYQKASEAAAQGILLSLVCSFFISLLGILYAPDILRLMGASEAVLLVGIPYTRLLLGANIVIMLLFILNGIFRGAGDASMAMRSLWIANIFNIVLDPVLIFGLGPFPEMGVLGAAIATTFGRGLGVLFQLYILFNKARIIQLTTAYFKPKIHLLRKIIDVSLTGMSQYIIGSASWIFLMRLVAEYGTDAVNGYGLAIRIILFSILPAWGIANAATTLVGQNLGAKQPQRAEQSAWLAAQYNFIFLFIISIIYYIWADVFIGFFNNNSAIIAVGAECLKILSLGYAIYGVAMVISHAFSGAGDTRTPTVVNLVSLWLLQIPLAYLLAKQFSWGPLGVYWAIIISETIMAIIYVILFNQGKWKTVQI